MKRINLDYLKDISGGSDVFVKEMIALFIEQTPEALANLEKYFGEKDWKQLRAVAHKMKPSFTFMGIKELEGDISRLEQLAEAEANPEQIAALIARINQICKEAIEELKGDDL